MSDDLEYAPLLLQRSFPVKCEGVTEVRALHWKAYAYTTGGTAWEVRRVFDTLIGESGKEVYKLLWSNNYFIDVFNRCLDTSSEVVPSYQAYAASPEKWNVPVWAVRQEHTITTSGLLVLLLEWSVKRRRKIERVRCNEVLYQFLRGIVIIGEIKEMLREALLEGVGECKMGVDSFGLCTHCQAVWVASETEVESHIACWVDHSLLNAGLETDILKDAWPPLLKHVDASGSAVKRPRLDEDMKRVATVGIIQSRRAHSASQLLRIYGLGSPCTASRWEVKFLSEMFGRAKQAVGEVSSLHVVLDAARFGHPAVELLAMFGWSAENDIAMVLPPQVPPPCVRRHKRAIPVSNSSSASCKSCSLDRHVQSLRSIFTCLLNGFLQGIWHAMLLHARHVAVLGSKKGFWNQQRSLATLDLLRMPATTAAERSAKHRRQADRLELKECMERVTKALKSELNWGCCPAIEKQLIRENRMKGGVHDIPATPAPPPALALPGPDLYAADGGEADTDKHKPAAAPKSMSSLSSTPWQKNITTVSAAPVYAMKMALGQVQPAVCTTGNFRGLGRSLHRELTLEIIEFYCQISPDFILGKSLRNDQAFVHWLIERGQECGGGERAVVLKNPMGWETQGVYKLTVADGELVATHRYSKAEGIVPWDCEQNGPYPSEVAINYSDARACVIAENGKLT
eukprot:2176312-Amphidinium_carterae.1